MQPNETSSKRMPSSATLRIRRYRNNHRRIDYFPAPDVLTIIAHHQTYGDPCIAGVIDDLIRAGHKAVSGNGVKK